MRNFVILFQEREGSSALMQFLDTIPKIDVLHQENNLGWEPFDRHNAGDLSSDEFERCANLIFGDDIEYMSTLNDIYGKSASRLLNSFSKEKSRGFKMRFRRFHQILPGILKRNNAVPFMLFRTDLLRAALSAYHGDGTGNKGFLQFKLARGKIRKDEIPSVRVEIPELRKIIRLLRRRNIAKAQAVNKLRKEGVDCQVITYEKFCENKFELINGICSKLEIEIADTELQEILDRGVKFEKVHSNDISNFVENADEVMTKIGEKRSNLAKLLPDAMYPDS